MRALLDENIPRALVNMQAPMIRASTVQQQGWTGLANGDLLDKASASFDVFITTDRGIPHQQETSRYPIGIILLSSRSNRIEDLAPLVPKIKALVSTISPGNVVSVAP
jgi:hypothetical protein